jgi:hypothetical protein
MANRYRVTFNGFTVKSETWDDATNTDGQHDEVFFQSVARKTRKDGTVIYNGDMTTKITATMGDVSSPATLGARVKAGSAERPWWQGGGQEGGLINGDTFPSTPTLPPQFHEMANDYPPCMIWEDTIADDEVVHIIPSIWEWDTASVLGGWLQALVQTDTQFGERAKKAFEPVTGAYGWIFDAVSLGIQTLGSIEGLFQPLGRPYSRPIGMTRDPANRNDGVFNPRIIELTPASAEALINANPTGAAAGLLAVQYVDDPYLRGHYVLYLQLHRVPSEIPREAHKLSTGGSLRRGDTLISRNGRFTLWMQPDGNLVLYDGAPAVGTAYWSTDTWRLPEPKRPTHVDMQADGHLVTYNDLMWPSWGTGVFGPNYIQPYLELLDNGNLVIFHNGQTPVWSTNTARA